MLTGLLLEIQLWLLHQEQLRELPIIFSDRQRVHRLRERPFPAPWRQTMPRDQRASLLDLSSN